MTPPDTHPPLPRWRLWLPLLGAVLPFACAIRLLLAGDVLVTPYNLHTLWSTILTWTSLKSTLHPAWWDEAVLGGFPLYASGLGGAWYPGNLLMGLVPNALLAWNLTLLAHCGIAAALVATACNRHRWPVPLTLAWMALFAGSMDAFYAIHTPAVVLVAPWLIWGVTTHHAAQPLVSRVARWGLVLGVAALIHWTALVVALVVWLVLLLRQRDPSLWLALIVGAALGAIQLVPLIETGGLWTSRDCLAALLGATHLVALVPVLALTLVWRDRARPMVIALIPCVIALYPFTWAIVLTLMLAVGVLFDRKLPAAINTVAQWAVPCVLLASGVAAPATVSVPYAGIKSLVASVRKLYPAKTNPSLMVLHPLSLRPEAAGLYGRPQVAASLAASATWPLLLNLAPDPGLGYSRVALPWNPSWRALLRTIDEPLGPAKSTTQADLIASEYLLQSLAISTFSSPEQNYPFLDYPAIDPTHPAGSAPAPTTDETHRDELEEDLLNAIDKNDKTPPAPPTHTTFEQKPIHGRYYYAARVALPWAVLLYRPAKPYTIERDTLAHMQRELVSLIQAETGYPFQLSLEERQRFALITDSGPGPYPVLLDKGYTLAAAPTVTDRPQGLDYLLNAQAAEAPWLLVRTALVGGWSATINGNPVTLAHVDGPWMAIPLTAGTALNTVQLSYRVPGYQLGKWITVTALIGLIALGLVGASESGSLYGKEADSPDTAIR
ncbi:MAG: hypothetical protein ABI743_01165 [bacterium]